MWNLSSKLYLTLVYLVIPVQQLFSQAGVASLSGRVLDPSAGIVSGATVTATNQGTKITRTTDNSGYYNFVAPLSLAPM